MSDKHERKHDHEGEDAVATQPAPTKPKPKQLPPYKVLLHNDDVNSMEYAFVTVHELTPLNLQDSKKRTMEAHFKGLSLLLITHKERAELYRDQFKSKGLTVTIEPDEE